MAWEKNPEEELLVGRNWEKDLDGAAIANVLPPVITPGTATIELNDPAFVGSTSHYWLRGGAKKQYQLATVSIETSEGEILSDKIEVLVR